MKDSKELLDKCNLSKGFNREKLLKALLQQPNKLLPADQLAKSVYGSAAKAGALRMVAVGLERVVRKTKMKVTLKKGRIDGALYFGLFFEPSGARSRNGSLEPSR